MLTLFGPIHVIWHPAIVTYATYHPLCETCRRKARRNSIFGRIAVALGVLAVTVGMVGLLGCLGAYVFDGWRGKGVFETIVCLMTVAGAGAGLLWAGRSLATVGYLRSAQASRFGLRRLRVVSADVRSTSASLKNEQQVVDREVQGAIAAGNLYRLGQVLGSLPAAVELYGKYCEARYNSTNAEASCCRCEGQSDLLDIVAKWQSPADGNRSTATVVEVQTHHRMCRRCWSGRFGRSVASFSMATIEITLASLGFAAALFGTVFVLGGISDSVAITVLVTLGGIVACIVAWRLERRRKKLIVPQRIAGIGLTPYRFSGMRLEE